MLAIAALFATALIGTSAAGAGASSVATASAINCNLTTHEQRRVTRGALLEELSR